MAMPKEKLMEMLKVGSIKENTTKKDGPHLPVWVWEPRDKTRVWVRVDMPGANVIRVEVDKKENRIKFVGLEDPSAMFGLSPVIPAAECRTYEGSLKFDAARFRANEKNYQLTNGLLLLEVESFESVSRVSTDDVVVETNQGMKESAYNPFVSEGKDRCYWYRFTNAGFLLAVDMPGLTNDGLTVNVQREKISFSVVQTEQHIYEATGWLPRRVYEGHFFVNLNKYHAQECQAEINHGVLWIAVPRVVVPPRPDTVVIPFLEEYNGVSV